MLYHTRYLTLTDIDIILELQSKVVQALDSTATLQPLSAEEFTTILSEDKLMIGMFDEERLISFRALLIPKLDDPYGHLGLDVGIPENELSKVIYSEVSVVDPDYRGKRLQTQMGLYLFERIDTEKFYHVCATVAPHNIPSLLDKLMLGMEIRALKEKYSGKLRYILYKDLRKKDESISTEDVTLVDLEDIDAQQKMLNEGFAGALFIKDAGKLSIGYRKL
ncbi:hypothetical protein AB4Y30_16040 [Ornithinibacillus sp. 4-3]|uniref:N-acetyltransferase domain-containing protein n=1 Tax=Ornithinibacillus sp. 4-3 TaxID=3231488 RepID=A0AB39HR73_9BACI